MMAAKFGRDKVVAREFRTARAWKNSNENWRRGELNPCSQLPEEYVIAKASEEFQVRLSLTEAKMLLGEIT
jgi:hypothetical protein